MARIRHAGPRRQRSRARRPGRHCRRRRAQPDHDWPVALAPRSRGCADRATAGPRRGCRRARYRFR